MRRRVLGEDNRLASQIGHRLDGFAHHDSVAAVRPVDLLVDAWHHPRVFAQAFEEERHHVERGPADVQRAGGVGVAHGHRVVNQDELELEVFTARSLPHLAGLEAVVRVDDRPPPGPDVDREPHGAIGHRLVAGDALDLWQLGARDVVVFLDRRDARVVRLLRAAGHLLHFFARELAAGSARCLAAVAPDRQADEAQNDEKDGSVESACRLSVRHSSPQER